jgi:hypothetical protein
MSIVVLEWTAEHQGSHCLEVAIVSDVECKSVEHRIDLYLSGYSSHSATRIDNEDYAKRCNCKKMSILQAT